MYSNIHCNENFVVHNFKIHSSVLKAALYLIAHQMYVVSMMRHPKLIYAKLLTASRAGLRGRDDGWK